jgi:Met-zincin/Domain of unknown function (DUF5117)
LKAIAVAVVGTLLLGSMSSLLAREGLPKDSCDSSTGDSALKSGLFIVHERCGRVLYEIPPHVLNRVMLINTEFAALQEREHDAQTSGRFADTRLVRWVRNGDQVRLELVKFEKRADIERGEMRHVSTVAPSVQIRSFAVLSEGGGGAPIIDVSELFLSDLPMGFAQEFRRRFHMVQVDPQRSYIDSVKAFSQNIEVKFSQTWRANPDDLAKQSESKDDTNPPTMGFLFQASMLLLPEQPMQGRYADSRVGYFSESFYEYGINRAGVQRRAFIQRYRLEKKDPYVEVSEPVRPIVFYIGREVPERWRPYIKQGVEDWRPAFERAGFRNAIVAKDAPTEREDPTWDPEDARYSVIRWVPGENGMGWGLADPRSGEVICSHATFWDSVFNKLENMYVAQVAPLDPRAQHLPLPDDVIGPLLRYVVSHEIGHALGLRHNFKAHSAYSVAQLRSRQWTDQWGTSASIMSYARFNYVAQPDDHASLLPRLGPYDYFAIEWGYKTLLDRDSDQEWDALDRLAARQVDDPMLRFGGEDEAALLDPTVMTGVLGDDPIDAGDLGLRNLDRTASILVQAATRKGHGYGHLQEIYGELVAQRSQELLAVARLIGGVVETRNQAQRGSIAFAPVSPVRQRAAVKFLVDRGFARPAALLDPDILRRIGPSASGEALQNFNKELLARMINPAVFQRMSEGQAGLPREQKYIGVDMLRDLNRGLFSELDQKRPIVSLYRRELQRAYLRVLVSPASKEDQRALGVATDQPSLFDLDSKSSRRGFPGQDQRRESSSTARPAEDRRSAPNEPSEFRGAVRAGMQDLASRIKVAQRRVKDDETSLHLADVLAELERGR